MDHMKEIAALTKRVKDLETTLARSESRSNQAIPTTSSWSQDLMQKSKENTEKEQVSMEEAEEVSLGINLGVMQFNNGI